MFASTATVTSYLLAAFGYYRFYFQKNQLVQNTGQIFLTLALCLHAGLLYLWIDTQSGQNLSVFNIVSFIMWLVSGVFMLLAIKRPIGQLLILMAPVTAVSVCIADWFPEHYVIYAAGHRTELVHILLGLFSFSLLTTAGILAASYLLQHYYLRARNSRMVLLLPPLDAVEILLFQLVWVGFSLLTISLLAGFLSAEHLDAALMKKISAAIAAWLVYAGLLWARYFRDWRGLPAVRAVTAGFVLLVLSYFGSRLLF